MNPTSQVQISLSGESSQGYAAAVVPVNLRQQAQQRITTSSKGAGDYEETRLSIHPYPTRDGVLVKFQGPREPKWVNGAAHAAVDVVLVIDVSGSMGLDAPVPGSNPGAEHNGLSILDLVKHAALTIAETLDEHDRLGIVTFSNKAHVRQRLVAMAPAEKDAARESIRTMAHQPVGQIAQCMRP